MFSRRFNVSRILEMMRLEMNQRVGEYLSELMRAELSHFLGREPYERKEGETNHRNGSYGRRFTMKRFGEVAVEVPRNRNGKFHSEVLPRSKRYEDELRKDICLMYPTGVSTRTLSMMSKQLLGRKISAGEVSRANGELVEAVERWRTRDLSQESIKYMLVDGVNFSMRVGKSVETVPVLVAVGVREDGTRLVLGLQVGDKESAACWRGFFAQFKDRWGKEVPSLVKCLENSMESCLTLFKLPPEQWQAFRTTSIIERLNKEFKRRIKSMEIVAGENACYQLLALISLKMDVHWKKYSIGKVAYNLPIFKKVPLLDFT